MRTEIQFALYAKYQPLRRRLDGKVDRVRVRAIRADVELVIAISVIRVVNLDSIRET